MDPKDVAQLLETLARIADVLERLEGTIEGTCRPEASGMRTVEGNPHRFLSVSAEVSTFAE